MTKSQLTDLRTLILSEVGDFFAVFGSPGEPETPEEMQRELSMRLGRILNNHIVNYPRCEVLVEILRECRTARDEAQAELQERRKAEMDNEPVCFVSERNLATLTKYRAAVKVKAEPVMVRPVALYRHPQPAPVVPDAATAIRACLSEFPESARDIVEECADIAENACRCAMLQAEPVTTANKLGNSPVIPDCWCRTCRPVALNDTRFVVCPDCGNKRCPRANDHRNSCTGSNEPGQEGSAYKAAPQEASDGQ